MCLFAAFTKSTRVNSQEYELKLVDTAGQDEYSIFPAQYSMDIHGYVLVYSITSSKSFEVVQIIYDKLLDMTGKVQLVHIFVLFVVQVTPATSVIWLPLYLAGTGPHHFLICGWSAYVRNMVSRHLYTGLHKIKY